MAWEQLTSIVAEAAAYAIAERTEPPRACPYDGEPLRETPGPQTGGRYCPLGNYRWPEQARLI